MKNLMRLLEYLKKYKIAVAISIFCIILEIVAELLLPTIMASIINRGIEINDGIYILKQLGLMLIITIIGAVGAVGSTYFGAKASQNAGADIRYDLYKKIQSFSFDNLDKFGTGPLITRISNDITQITEIIGMMLRVILRAPLLLLGSIIMAIIISPRLSLIFLILMPAMLIIIGIVVKLALPLYKSLQLKVDKVNTVVQENLTGIRTVKAFGREKYEIKKFNEASDNLKNATIKANHLMNLVMPIMLLFMNTMIILSLYFGGDLYAQSLIEIGDILAFIEYAMIALVGLIMTAMVITALSKSEASAIRINEVLDEKTAILNLDQTKDITNLVGEIEFKNVFFAHKKSEMILKDISFKIKPGEMLAIIGATGSGKSTLVNLIPRFYDVTKGAILLDGINIKEYSKKELRDHIGIVLQKSFIFSGTIASNISYGSNLTKEEITNAAKLAEATPFIENLENAFDAVVDARGTNFSGGQKQRIVIARALAKNPKILILDDSTSAIDVKTESKIKKSLKKIMKNKTTIIVAQRISSVLDASKIIVLDQGEINGIGTHDELMKANKIYKDIYDSQLGGK